MTCLAYEDRETGISLSESCVHESPPTDLPIHILTNEDWRAVYHIDNHDGNLSS